MKLFVRSSIIFSTCILLLGCGLTAPINNEGYADLDSLGTVDVDHTMTLSLGPTILNFAALHIDKDPELSSILRALDGVRIKIYEIDGDATRVAIKLADMSQKLREKNWEPVMLVREEGEQVHMLMKVTGERISGLTLLTSDSREVIIVNIMGVRGERNR